jgi:tetratricopeptide (TPR) repeat protein
VRTIAAAFAAIAVWTAAAAPAAAADTFGEANQLYTSGEFEAAATAYEALVARGIANEDLYYNLGNAYFRTGRLGPAIYNYERALRLDPGFDDARYNLAVAREVVAERFGTRLKGAETDPLWIRVSTYFSISRLTLWFLLLNALFFAVLIGLRFLAEGLARTALVVTSAFVGVAMAASLALLAGHGYYLERVKLGVVTGDQVVMREGPDERRAERGVLHPGLRVRIRGEDQEWIRVRLSNGVDGWVPRGSIGRL